MTAPARTLPRAAPVLVHLVAVRAAEEAEAAVIEGRMIPFSGPYPGNKDSYGTYFTARTDYALDWFDERPLLWNHGLDKDAGISPVGTITSLEIREDGVWMRAILDTASTFYSELRSLIEAGRLWLSHATLGHLMRVDDETGEVLQWPVVEGTLTPTPANSYAEVGLAAARSHFEAARLDVSALARHGESGQTPHAESAAARGEEARMTGNATTEQTPTPAPVEPVPAPAPPTPAVRADFREGSYEDLMEDLSEAINPDSPYGGAWSSILATYPDHVLVCRYDYHDDDEISYWSIPYTVGEDGEITLGAATQMEQQFAPVAEARSRAFPLTIDAALTMRQGQALLKRTEDLQQRRGSEGRSLSEANTRALRQTAEALRANGEAIVTFLRVTEESASAAAKAAYRASPAYQAHQIALMRLALDA